MRRLLLSARAFTLIELLVVILVIGILIAVAAPSFLGQTEKAEDAAAKQYLTVAYKAAKAYSVDGNGTPGHVQGNFDGFDEAALEAMEPGLTVTDSGPGSCPAIAAGQDHDEIFIDTASGDDLTICNDPEGRVWTLQVVDGVLQPLELCEWDGSECTNQAPGPDVTLPTVEITSPADGATVSGVVNVTATASDNVGVVGVQFSLDGVDLGPEDTEAPYEASWDTETADNGAHVLSAVARDAADNAQAFDVNVTVANTVLYSSVIGAEGSLARYWRLGETSGSFIDQKGVTNMSLVAAGTAATRGQSGALLAGTGDDNSLQLNFNGNTSGGGNYGNASASAATWNTLFGGTTAFSAEAWIRPTGTKPSSFNGTIFGTWDYIFSTNQGWSLDRTWPAGTLVFNRGASPGPGVTQVTTTLTASLDNWHHVVASYDGTTMRIYLDGVLAAAGASTANLPSGNSSFYVGNVQHFNGSSARYFPGKIDEVAIYNTALSCGTTTVGQACTAGSQIKTHYNAAGY